MNSCSLCEKLYLAEERFNIYLCYDCHNKTSFCMNCDKIMSKIFNYMNIFKCEYCKKIAPALLKQLVEMENNQKNSNPNNNISTNNDINDNKILLSNNFNYNSPNENIIKYPLNMNKISITTPPTYSSFISDLRNNNNLQKNEEKNNISNQDTNFKINKNIHLVNGKNGRELLKDNKRNILLQLNKYKDKIQ